MITTDFEGVRYLDQAALWTALRGVDHADRLGEIIRHSGGVFHSGHPRLLTTPVVMVRSFGGMPIVIGPDGVPCVGTRAFPLGAAIDAARTTMGCAGMDAYLNPNDRDAGKMHEVLVKAHGVPSTAHLPSLGIFVAGLSLKAELELNCQRDVVHLSRLTSARTSAQDRPPVLVEKAAHIPIVKQVLNVIPQTDTADREAFNSLFPLAKCSLLGISGSLKSLLKIGALADDEGKEREVRRICDEIRIIVLTLFPEFL